MCARLLSVGVSACDTQQLGSSLTLRRGCGAEAAEVYAAVLACMFPEEACRNWAFGVFRQSFGQNACKKDHPKKTGKNEQNLAECLRIFCGDWLISQRDPLRIGAT